MPAGRYAPQSAQCVPYFRVIILAIVYPFTRVVIIAYKPPYVKYFSTNLYQTSPLGSLLLFSAPAPPPLRPKSESAPPLVVFFSERVHFFSAPDSSPPPSRHLGARRRLAPAEADKKNGRVISHSPSCQVEGITRLARSVKLAAAHNSVEFPPRAPLYNHMPCDPERSDTQSLVNC